MGTHIANENIIKKTISIKRRCLFMLKKFFLLSAIGVILIFGLNNCGKKTEVAETAKTEDVTMALTPSLSGFQI